MNDNFFMINGLRKYKPRSMDYQLRTLPLKKHLEDILGRLEGEVQVIKTSIESYNSAHQNDNIGFFSMVRLLTPIIEATATAIGETPQKLLELMGITSPHLRWTLYRDIFLHNDELAFAAIEQTKQGAASGVIFTDDNQTDIEELVSNTGSLFDPMGVHRKLVEYIKGLIKEASSDSTTEVIEAVLLDEANKTNPEIQKIVSEIQTLHNA